MTLIMPGKAYVIYQILETTSNNKKTHTKGEGTNKQTYKEYIKNKTVDQ